MSTKLFDSVYKAASQITVHRYASAIGSVGRPAKPAGKGPKPATVATKPAKPPKKGG